MTVQTILQRKGTDVFTIELNVEIERAARLMYERNIAALVVTSNGRVVGTLSHRDIANGFSRHGSRLSALRVGDLMQREFVRVSPQDSVKHVMALMTRQHTTHIPVFASERLTGIVSIGDVVKHRLEDLELETNVLRDAYIAAR